jgi:hypothetical protein
MRSRLDSRACLRHGPGKLPCSSLQIRCDELQIKKAAEGSLQQLASFMKIVDQTRPITA